MRITDTPITVGNFLKDYTELNIPLYQRDYSWQEEQWSDLLSDLMESTPNTENLGEGHFLGSILIHENIANNIKQGEIIDGQQRTTTLFLIFQALRKRFNKLRKNPEAIRECITGIDSYIFQKRKGFGQIQLQAKTPKLTLGRRGGKLFKNLICENLNHNEKGKDEAELNLLAASKFFQDKVSNLKYEETIKLLNQTAFAELIVIVSEKPSERTRLFKTLNARGLELSQSDLIKNEICKAANEEEIESIIDRWENDIREKLGKTKLDTFIFHHLNSKTEYLELRHEVEKRKTLKISKDYPFVSEKRVFDVLEQKLSSETINLDLFLDDLANDVNIYKNITSPTKTRSKETYDYLIGLKVLKISKAYPVILAAKRNLNAKDFLSIIRAIEIISFRHSIMRFDPKDLEKLYYSIIPKLGKESIGKIIGIMKSFKTNKEEAIFREGFKKLNRPDLLSKYILMRILNSYQENISWESRGSIHLEHIMPKRPKSGSIWHQIQHEDRDKYKLFVQRLGNLTLLKDKLNITASNKDFKEKKKTYKKSRFAINNTISNSNSWSYSMIERNQNELYKLANKNKIWKL